jgi:TRAP-type C4-dicarboxylate transport system substrate-binding protein
MKHLKIWTIALAAVVFLTLSAGGAYCAQAEKQFNLKFSHPMAATSYSHKAYLYFADAVAKESNGSVKFTVYPSGTLVSDAEGVDAARKGNVEITQFQSASASTVVKELTVLQIPGIYRGDRPKVLEQALRPALEKIFAKYDLHYVAQLPHDVLVFVGSKIVKTTSDIKGMKVRVAGKWNGEAVKLWGGSPMTIPIGDVPTALERKTIDLVNTSWIATGGFKLYESGPNVTLTSLQEIFPGLIMNLKIWNSMSPGQQAAFDRATKQYLDYGSDLMLKEKEAFLNTCKNAKVNVYTMTDAENAPFKEAAKKLIEEVKPIIGPDGEALIKAFSIPQLQ